jgi:hypothetical protein
VKSFFFFLAVSYLHILIENGRNDRWESPAPWDPVYDANISTLSRVGIVLSILAVCCLLAYCLLAFEIGCFSLSLLYVLAGCLLLTALAACVVVQVEKKIVHIRFPPSYGQKDTTNKDN